MSPEQSGLASTTLSPKFPTLPSKAAEARNTSIQTRQKCSLSSEVLCYTKEYTPYSTPKNVKFVHQAVSSNRTVVRMSLKIARNCKGNIFFYKTRIPLSNKFSPNAAKYCIKGSEMLRIVQVTSTQPPLSRRSGMAT